MRNLGLKGSPLQWQEIATSQTLGSGYGYIVTASSNITLTLPANPDIGATVAITVLGAGDVTIALNGKKWQGFNNNRLIKGRAKRALLEVVYAGSLSGWQPNNPDLAPMSAWTKAAHCFEMNKVAFSSSASIPSACSLGVLNPNGVGLALQQYQVGDRFLPFNQFDSNAARTWILPSALGNIGNSLTVIVGLRLAAKAADRFAIGKWYDTGQQQSYQLQYQSAADRWTFLVSSTGSNNALVQASDFGSPAVNTNYLIRAYNDATIPRMGIAVNEIETTAVGFSTIFAGSQPLYIGAAFNNLLLYNGQIAIAYIFSGVIDANEGAEIYNAGSWQLYPELWR